MKLNHLSLAVPDVAATSAFMEKYFCFRQQEIKGNHIIAVLEGTGNFILVLTTLNAGESTYPADFHFGFMLEDEAAVTTIYSRLLADGYDVPREPAKIRNSFAFYFHIPGGILAEISCNL